MLGPFKTKTPKNPKQILGLEQNPRLWNMFWSGIELRQFKKFVFFFKQSSDDLTRKHCSLDPTEIISTAKPVLHMHRQICWPQVFGFTHLEVIFYKKFHLLHHQDCPDFSRCWFIACSSSSYPPYISLQSPMASISYSKLFLSPDIFTGTVVLSMCNFNLWFLPSGHCIVKFWHTSQCILFKLVSIIKSLPGSLWAAL